MTKFRLELNLAKCQAYGKCAAAAPAFFRLDDSRKVALAGASEAVDEIIVKAAKSCPYRVITVIDTETNEPVFPVRRR
jgi:ferredoxin